MSTTFSPLYVDGIKVWRSRASNSRASSSIWPEIELVRDFVPDLVTCKFYEDPIKIESSIMSTTFFPIISLYGSFGCLGKQSFHLICPIAKRYAACSPPSDASHKMSRDMTKPTMWLCAQRRLRSAWASSPPRIIRVFAAWRKLGSLATHWAHSEDSEQTGRVPRLIWVFAGRTLILLVLSCRGSNVIKISPLVRFESVSDDDGPLLYYKLTL